MDPDLFFRLSAYVKFWLSCSVAFAVVVVVAFGVVVVVVAVAAVVAVDRAQHNKDFGRAQVQKTFIEIVSD